MPERVHRTRKLTSIVNENEECFFIKCCSFHHQHIIVLKKKLRFLIKFSSTLSKWMRMSHFINKNQKRQFIWRDDLFIWGLLPGVKAWFWSNHFFYFIFCLMEIELLSLKQSRIIICWCTQRDKHFSTVSLFELQPVSKLKFMSLISMLSLYPIYMDSF